MMTRFFSQAFLWVGLGIPSRGDHFFSAVIPSPAQIITVPYGQIIYVVSETIV